MIRTGNRVALYARFSSDNQRSESIDAQVRAMTAYCKQRNYIIVETYIDEAKSATTDRIPSFQQMIADSQKHLFDIVLVHKLDRFARNRYDSAVYKRELKKNGVAVYSVREHLDDSPESIMLEAVIEGVNEWYSHNLATEVMKGMRENALKCLYNGGYIALGYQLDQETRKLVINPEEAETVKIIFDLYSKGHGYSYIIDTLNAQGRKTKAGNPFCKSSLYSILTNPKYQGMYVFNRSSAKDYNGRRNTHRYKDDEDIIAIEGGCPQIVTKETYEKVQARITAQKHTGGRMNAKENYLLSGKVTCKDCGRSMVGNKRKAGRNHAIHITYRCPSRNYNCNNKEINKVYLEEYVIYLLEKEIFNAASLKRLTKAIGKQEKTLQQVSSCSAFQYELEDTEKALNNVAEAIAAGLISDVLITKLKELEEKKAKLEIQIANNSALCNFAEIDTSTILSEYTRLKETPASPEYREFICSFIDKIIVGKYTVDITLKTGLDAIPELNNTYTVRRQEIYERRKVAL